MKISILHLADLHINIKKIDDIKFIIDGLIKDLKTLRKEKSINPNLIFFTGDIINKGQNAEEEFSLFEDFFINPLLSELKLSQNELFLVPGNHEINRLQSSEIFETKLQERLTSNDAFTTYFESFKETIDYGIIKQKLDSYLKFKNSIRNSNLVFSDFFFDVYKYMVGEFEIGIIALNSAWRSSGFGSDDRRLIIGEKIFNDAHQLISDCKLKLVLSHHPFEMLCDWDSKTMQIAMARNIDILFTGHIHDSEFSYAQQIYGSLYVSTCGSLHSGRIRNGYSLVNIDLEQKKLGIYLRSWYNSRKEFDQETEKSKDGIIEFDNFQLNNQEANELIEINSIKNKLQYSLLPANIIYPFENINQVKLEDVFVEPLISDKSSFDKDHLEKKYFELKKIIESDNNIIFFSRKEYGKTSLLKHIQTEVLKNEKKFESIIPVYVEFSQIPKNNYKSIKRIIRIALEGLLNDSQIEQYLTNGNLIILIDDFDDYSDDFRDKRKFILKQIFNAYPKCRYILTINEKISQTFKQESFSISQYLPSKNYYLASFNTSSIRKLLEKWCCYENFNVDKMLNQIVFYFQQLRIPVTPMAVTLFIGVLIRDRASQNLNNEAYLIENYLETILEKLDINDIKADLDFREKESFLSHIAYMMIVENKFEFSKLEFERHKLDYFTLFGEDLPNSNSFDLFFTKCILQEKNKMISFQFKFWFYFFLAKAMQKKPERMHDLLKRTDFLKFSTAFSYKAGLSRNDKELLAIIDEKTQENIQEFIHADRNKHLDDYQIESGLVKFSENIENKIKDKNIAEDKDRIKDQTHLSYDADDQKLPDEDAYDDVIQLVILNSDLIRNTREIHFKAKERFLKNNVNSYLTLMWQTLEIFREMIDEIDKEQLKNLFIENDDIDDDDFNFEKIIKRMHEFTYQIIPLSIILFMSEHLSNPKLKNTVIRLLTLELKLTDKLFYALLLFKLDIESALIELEKLVKDSKSSYVYDHLIYLYVIVYCRSTKLDQNQLNMIIKFLKKIRKKYSVIQKELPLFVKDTFASDFRKDSLLKKQ